jgi:hypothetical protein
MIIDDFLRNLEVNGSLVEVHILDEDERFSLCKLLGNYDEWLHFSLFDRDGEYDGQRYVRTSEVRRFKTDTAYARRSLSRTAGEPIPAFFGHSQSINEALRWCKESRRLVVILVGDVVYSGVVVDGDSCHFLMNLLDEETLRFDGRMLARTTDITYIEVDSQSLRRQSAAVELLDPSIAIESAG